MSGPWKRWIKRDAGESPWQLVNWAAKIGGTVALLFVLVWLNDADTREIALLALFASWLLVLREVWK